MAEVRSHVVRPLTIIGMEKPLLAAFALVATPVSTIVLFMCFWVFPGWMAPIGFVGTVAGIFYAGYRTVLYNQRNPDFGARLAEHINYTFSIAQKEGFRRQRRCGWKTKREIYAR